MSIVTTCYYSVFGVMPGEEDISKLIKIADTMLVKEYNPLQLEAIKKAIEKNLNLQNVEYLTRCRDLNNPLTIAFKMATSIGECSLKNYNYFTNTEKNRLALGLILTQSVLRLIYCMLKKPLYTQIVKDIVHA